MSANSNLVPTTELDAVNLCLASIGEAPVASITSTALSDVALAVEKVREASRVLQKRGWSFNKNEDSLQARTIDGYLMVPQDALHADLTRGQGRRAARRGDKMWDRDNNTFVWDVDLKMDFILFLAYDLLPEAARYYISVRAARMFARAALGSPGIEQFTENDERVAWADFLREEARAANHNVFRNNQMLDRSSDYVYIPYV